MPRREVLCGTAMALCPRARVVRPIIVPWGTPQHRVSRPPSSGGQRVRPLALSTRTW
jgi:hypothetical protein